MTGGNNVHHHENQQSQDYVDALSDSEDTLTSPGSSLGERSESELTLCEGEQHAGFILTSNQQKVVLVT